MRLRFMLVVLMTFVLCAVAQASVVTSLDVTFGHSFTWGWVDNGDYNADSISDQIDFFGVKVVSGASLEAPSPIVIGQVGWTSWLNGDGTAGATGPALVPGNFNIFLTHNGSGTPTKVELAAFKGNTLVGTLWLKTDGENPFSYTQGEGWDYVTDWEPTRAEFVPEPATILIWSLLGATWMGGLTIVRRRRQAWAPESRQAIVEMIEGGRKSN